ncbi:matrixin family metalloprotease [bacterium]|nr:matrixin family metalloprotease [bacterium]
MNRLTYLNAHLKNGCLIRWPEKCFPLPVYIAPCTFYSLAEADRYMYINMAAEAINTWEAIGQGRFSFVLAPTLNDSQMNVEWRRVDRKSLGNCTFNYDKESRLYSAEVSIGISDGILHQKYMDENEVYHTILHEIGHALGLGHSPNPDDIMFTPHQYGKVTLSQRDINTVRWLYNLPLGSSVDSLNKTYSTSCTNIDDIIMKIEGGEATSQFQKTLNNINSAPKRSLEDDQKKLAQIKKFQLSIQNVKLPKELADKFKDMS